MFIRHCNWNIKQMLNASFHYFQSLSKKCLCMLQTTPLLCRIQTRLWCDTGAWHSVLLDKDHEGGGGQEQGDGVKAVIILLRLQMLQVAEGGKGEGGVCRRRRAIHTQEQVAGQLEGCRGAPKISWGWRQWLAGRRAGKTRVQTLPRLARCCLLLAPSLGLCCKGITVLPPPLGRSAFSRSLFAWRWSHQRSEIVVADAETVAERMWIKTKLGCLQNCLRTDWNTTMPLFALLCFYSEENLDEMPSKAICSAEYKCDKYERTSYN